MSTTRNNINGRRDVWYARAAFVDQGLGWLVTEPGNPHQPIAFVPVDNKNDLDITRGCQLADRIARHTIDLSPFGRPDSNRPTPSWLYSILLYPADEGDGPAYGAKPIECSPLCRFRLASMVHSVCEAAGFAPDKAKRYLVAGRCEHPDGTGETNTIVIGRGAEPLSPSPHRNWLRPARESGPARIG